VKASEIVDFKTVTWWGHLGVSPASS